MAGGVPEHLPFGPNVEAQLASSFVNRVTPANVGGMALNVRFMQKAGVDPAEAVTGIGLNVAAGGHRAHGAARSCSSRGRARATRNGFKIPSSSKLLVVIAVVLARRRHRRGDAMGAAPRPHARASRFLKQSWSEHGVLARSPAKLARAVRRLGRA